MTDCEHMIPAELCRVVGCSSRSARSVATGPGSRGGRIHEPEYRRAYLRAWRAAHPEYRERERLRRARQRAREAGNDPATVVEPPSFPRPLPLPAESCACDCGCRSEVVMVCGFCRDGMHGLEDAS